MHWSPLLVSDFRVVRIRDRSPWVQILFPLQKNGVRGGQFNPDIEKEGGIFEKGNWFPIERENFSEFRF